MCTASNIVKVFNSRESSTCKRIHVNIEASEGRSKEEEFTQKL